MTCNSHGAHSQLRHLAHKGKPRRLIPCKNRNPWKRSPVPTPNRRISDERHLCPSCSCSRAITFFALDNRRMRSTSPLAKFGETHPDLPLYVTITVHTLLSVKGLRYEYSWKLLTWRMLRVLGDLGWHAFVLVRNEIRHPCLLSGPSPNYP